MNVRCIINPETQKPGAVPIQYNYFVLRQSIIRLIRGLRYDVRYVMRITNCSGNLSTGKNSNQFNLEVAFNQDIALNVPHVTYHALISKSGEESTVHIKFFHTN